MWVGMLCVYDITSDSEDPLAIVATEILYELSNYSSEASHMRASVA